MKKHPFLYMVFGVLILIIPTAIYLYVLIPKLTAEYNTLMASGGVVTGSGYYIANNIPETWKNSSLYKTACKSFTMLITVTIVQEFINELIGLVAVFIVSFIIFKLLKGAYKNGKRRRENTELAKEISRTITKNSQ